MYYNSTTVNERGTVQRSRRIDICEAAIGRPDRVDIKSTDKGVTGYINHTIVNLNINAGSGVEMSRRRRLKGANRHFENNAHKHPRRKT